MKRIYFPFLITLIFFAPACKKFLDKKNNQKQVVPTSVRDFQALIEETRATNYAYSFSAEVGAGDYYLPDATLKDLDESTRNMYVWNKDNLFSGTNIEWGNLYKLIYKCNIILNDIDAIERLPGEEEEWKAVKGSAFFLRGNCYSQLVWLWSLAYDPATAEHDLGAALRLKPDFNEVSRRVSVQESYRQIISDLEQAAGLLPVTSAHVVIPSRPAAYALLSRIYLSMRNYDKALVYADSCLQMRDYLMDYNTDPNITPAVSYPFKRFNPEMLYLCGALTTSAFFKGIADTALYNMYAEDDLRKKMFFNGNKGTLNRFKGNYEGNNIQAVLFTGPATDEMMLVRAECLARKGDVALALNNLNTLLRKRYKTGRFTDYASLSDADALQLILDERRKELVFRGLRWMDIKRLNKEGANISLKRMVNGSIITLEPNSLRYALPIPDNVIQLSGMQQNPR
ncbi:MAG: RagB/SusD family nutrient uptake outer membrane protein [Niabella sp.]|nr:RagB/SusD family nutrient uptake outer membrane protein [Niabella sp.]